MKKSFFKQEAHVGKQPIRVLMSNVADRWEHVNPTFAQDFFLLMEKHGIEPRLYYDYSEVPIVIREPTLQCCVPFVNERKEITIHETFLSFVWTMCYAHLVLFSEYWEKPSINRLHGQERTIDNLAAATATNVFAYGMSLREKYTPWDKNALPNPEEYSESEEFYVARANTLFTYATVFILCHELAHIELGHLDNTANITPSADQLLDEIYADFRAVDTMLRGAQDADIRFNYEAGMLLCFCSLLNLRRDLDSNSHPSGDDRIDTLLKRLELQGESPLWGIATMSLLLWDDYHNASNRKIRLPGGDGNYRDIFYRTLQRIRAGP